MKKLTKTTTLLAVIFSCLLVAGCSQKIEFEGVECIKTTDILATNLECNWDKYNAQPQKPWLNKGN